MHALMSSGIIALYRNHKSTRNFKTIQSNTPSNKCVMFIRVSFTFIGEQYAPGTSVTTCLVWQLRVVHGSDGPAGRVGSGHDFAGFWRVGSGRVGSGQHFGFISFLLIISWYLNWYESSNTTFELIDFHRYLIYNY